MLTRMTQSYLKNNNLAMMNIHTLFWCAFGYWSWGKDINTLNRPISYIRPICGVKLSINLRSRFKSKLLSRSLVCTIVGYYVIVVISEGLSVPQYLKIRILTQLFVIIIWVSTDWRSVQTNEDQFTLEKTCSWASLNE